MTFTLRRAKTKPDLEGLGPMSTRTVKAGSSIVCRPAMRSLRSSSDTGTHPKTVVAQAASICPNRCTTRGRRCSEGPGVMIQSTTLYRPDGSSELVYHLCLKPRGGGYV